MRGRVCGGVGGVCAAPQPASSSVASTSLRHDRRVGTVSPMSRISLTSMLFIVLAAGCSSSPASVQGTYTTNLTNGANGCMVSMWMEGQVTSGVPITITQSGASVTGTVTGATATYLDLTLGAHVFAGGVSGNHVDMI